MPMDFINLDTAATAICFECQVEFKFLSRIKSIYKVGLIVNIIILTFAGLIFIIILMHIKRIIIYFTDFDLSC